MLNLADILHRRIKGAARWREPGTRVQPAVAVGNKIPRSATDLTKPRQITEIYRYDRGVVGIVALAKRSHDMNHFLARLIFCLFAEDTNIFNGVGLLTKTIEQMSSPDSSNTHEVMSEIFRAMNTPINKRADAILPRWADTFDHSSVPRQH